MDKFEQMQKDIADLKKFCFEQNNAFQDKAFEAILKRLEVAGLGIGKKVLANSSSILELTSTSKGFRPPRMTQAQRDAITNPDTILIYNTDTDKLNLFTTTWEEVQSI